MTPARHERAAESLDAYFGRLLDQTAQSLSKGACGDAFHTLMIAQGVKGDLHAHLISAPKRTERFRADYEYKTSRLSSTRSSFEQLCKVVRR